MKLLAIFAGLVLASDGLSDLEQWQQFKMNHEKTYRSGFQEKRRFEIFQSNLRRISEHNKKFESGEVSYTLGITNFADLTEAEFASTLTPPQVMIKKRWGKLRFVSTRGLTLPESVDWREEGAVSYVKTQGVCGACWAITATGAIEGQIAISNGSFECLSFQNLLDCADEKYGNFGCKGGMINTAFEYAISNGILPEKDYPYKGYDNRGKCQQSTQGVKIKDYVDIVPYNERALQEAVATKGPVALAIDARRVDLYKSGVVDFKCRCNNDKNSLNHAVLLVGYGTQNGEDYWLIKNSWGTKWGEQGYLKLKRDGRNTCGITLLASFPVL